MSKFITPARDAEAMSFLSTYGQPSPPPRPRTRSAAENFFQDWNGGSKGGFAGGRLDRLTEDWDPGTTGPNQMYRMGVKRMRERARDLVQNNPLAKSAVEGWVTNVLDCGVLPKPLFADNERRKLWVKYWNRWGGEAAYPAHSECDIAGEKTINEVMEMWLTEIIVAGGCLIHYRELPRRGRMLPLALQLISEERFADHIEVAANGNQVINGCEIDAATGRTVAYHVMATDPNDLTYSGDKVVRLPAEECEYSAFLKLPGQKRGYTGLHAVIVWLWALGYYTDNELHNSDIKSSWAYMITTNPENYDGFNWNELLGEHPTSGTTDIYGNPISRHESGQIFRGAPGDDIKPVGPNVPGGDSLPWLMMIQRIISIGMGMSYEELLRDYTKGSFSSVRASSQGDRKRYRRVQKFAGRRFCNQTWLRFGIHGVRAGLEGFPSPAEFQSDIENWLDVGWGFPGWESVNPREDAQADDLELENDTVTMQQILERRGRGDVEEHFAQIARENVLREKYGIKRKSSGSTDQSNPTESDRDSAEQQKGVAA